MYHKSNHMTCYSTRTDNNSFIVHNNSLTDKGQTDIKLHLKSSLSQFRHKVFCLFKSRDSKVTITKF